MGRMSLLFGDVHGRDEGSQNRLRVRRTLDDVHQGAHRELDPALFKVTTNAVQRAEQPELLIAPDEEPDRELLRLSRRVRNQRSRLTQALKSVR
jgi:hypothetical protein